MEQGEKYIFPSDFEWGIDATAYQVEGAWNEEGKGESVWDRFVHQPGSVADDDTDDTACDPLPSVRGERTDSLE